MSPLAPHPIGIKYWTNIWKGIADVPYSTGPQVGAQAQAVQRLGAHEQFANWYGLKFQRTVGRYFLPHRAGPMGALAPMVMAGVGLKVFSMYYGSMRDSHAAQSVAEAYGTGGYKVEPTPK